MSEAAVKGLGAALMVLPLTGSRQEPCGEREAAGKVFSSSPRGSGCSVSDLCLRSVREARVGQQGLCQDDPGLSLGPGLPRLPARGCGWGLPGPFLVILAAGGRSLLVAGMQRPNTGADRGKGRGSLHQLWQEKAGG